MTKSQGSDQDANRSAETSGGTSLPRRLLLGVIAVVAMWGGALFLWSLTGPQVGKNPAYHMLAEDMAVTPQPPWIRADVKAEVIRDAGLSGDLNLLDSDLAERLEAAFALHPWVAKASRVVKGFPSRIEVHLEYRKPVLMVETAGGLFPIDRDAVQLPSEDFSPDQAGAYLRLGGITTMPHGEGTPWDDARVIQAALIADALWSDWKKLGLYQLLPGPRSDSAPDSDPDWFYLTTRTERTRVFWGHGPVTPGSQEPPAS
ncbi:MAG: hypothetical protein N2C14_09730, partial [Planctomycetales bacterium]